MSFNRQNLNTAMAYHNVSSGNIEVHYDFSGQSGDLVYNRIYPTGFHFVTGDTKKFFSYAYPGLSIGYNDEPISANNISGYFDSSSLIRVGIKNDFSYYLYINGLTGFQQIPSGIEKETLSDYTVFMNLRMSGDNYGVGKNKVIWSTMDGENSSSGGYVIGFNDTYDLCVDWITKTGASSSTHRTRRKILPIDKLSDYNIISFEKNANASDDMHSNEFSDDTIQEHSLRSSLKINLHDVARNEMDSAEIFLENMAHPSGDDKLIEKWYIGNTPFASDHYTGFSGHVDDFVLIKGANYPPDFLKLVADQYFVTGEYKPKRRDLSEVSIQYLDSTESGSGLGVSLSYNPDSFSVTENVPQLTGDADDRISVYGPDNPWSGTHELVATGSISDTASSYTSWEFTDLPEEKLLGGTERLYTYKYITLYDKSNANDIYEIYLNTGKIENKFNLSTNYSSSIDKFYLGDEYSGAKINVFSNGLVQFENIDYNQPTNPLWDRTVDFSGSFDEGDLVVYDEQVINAFYSGFESNEKIEMVASEFVDKDVYFFGEKLVSGLDYTGYSDRISINATELLTTGYLYFTDQRKGVAHFTGLGSDLTILNQPILDEQLWLNGIRQVEKINYSLLRNTGIINTGFRLEAKLDNVFNNNEKYLNYL